MTYSSYSIIQHVCRTLKYTFISTHKHLLHMHNKKIKPTHHNNTHTITHEFNVVHPNWATSTMNGFLYYSFIFSPYNTSTLCSNKIHQFYLKFPSHSHIQCTLSSFDLTLISQSKNHSTCLSSLKIPPHFLPKTHTYFYIYTGA
jgi:hypothetical protein